MENAARQVSRLHWKRAWPGRVIGLRAMLTAGTLWLLLHVVLFAGSGEVAPVSSFKGLLVLVAIASVAGVADLRRNRESVFLQNLGVAPLVVPAIWVAVAVLLEITIALLVQ